VANPGFPFGSHLLIEGLRLRPADKRARPLTRFIRDFGYCAPGQGRNGIISAPGYVQTKPSAFDVFGQHRQPVVADFGEAAADLDFLRG